MHAAQRLLANAPARHVDDPLKRQIVGGTTQHAHIGHGVTDFGAFVEPQSTHHAIRHAQ